MANTEWFSYFLASSTEFLEPIESDHRPLIVSICSDTVVKKALKKFYGKEGFKETVMDEWLKFPMEMDLQTKLRQTRRHIAHWKRINRSNRMEKFQS